MRFDIYDSLHFLLALARWVHRKGSNKGSKGSKGANEHEHQHKEPSTDPWAATS
jgi:hypothetical protein